MRLAALVVALFTTVVSIAGTVSPDHIMMLRLSYYTPGGLYIAGELPANPTAEAARTVRMHSPSSIQFSRWADLSESTCIEQPEC